MRSAIASDDSLDAAAAAADDDARAPAPVAPTYGPDGVKSAPAPLSSAPDPAPARPPLAPGDKLRTSVRRLIHLRRSTAPLHGGIGDEPGIDPRRAGAHAAYAHVRARCVIDVADYGATRCAVARMGNAEFAELMGGAARGARPAWARVRWINVGGISWDVISAVALKYQLHPLSIEDILHPRGHSRSKADYYAQHLFLRILCHELGDDAADDAFVPVATLAASPEPFAAADDARAGEDDATVFGSTSSTLSGVRAPRRPDDDVAPADADAHRRSRRARLHQRRDERLRAEITIAALKRAERVRVRVQPLFVFLLRDGTVVSMHPAPDLAFTAPIAARLRTADSGLRTSADASLLVQSLLDLVVDQALEVIDEFQVKIRKFEKDILLKPKMGTVRNLHILSGDLISHKRTLEPIKTVIYGLRRYDLDRCAAIVDETAAGPKPKVVGFMSHRSKIYLADVYDHMDYILTSLDMFTEISENLVNYTFNMLSYEMNEVMRRLTLATIIFLPLTLLTGYFGMNFDNMWTIHHGHSDVVFWIIALPVLAVVLPMFIVPDIKRMVHYVEKRAHAQRAFQAYKHA